MPSSKGPTDNRRARAYGGALYNAPTPPDTLREAAQEALDAWDSSVVNGDVEPAMEALRVTLAPTPPDAPDCWQCADFHATHDKRKDFSTQIYKENRDK
jgi:hypothetical protein